jgi:negative regulator of sigma E activity
VDTERLAAFLDGELDADEAAAVEAALAGDPRLRAELAAMRRADEALGSLPATELPSGFEARLRSRLDAELADLLGTSERAATAGAGAEAPSVAAGTDELAARRARRSRSWVPAFAGAAAAVAVIAGTMVGIGVLGSGGDDASTADSDTAMTMEAFDGDETASDDAGEAFLPGPGEAPTLVATGEDLDEAGADDLLDAIELQAVAAQGFDEELGRGVGIGWREALARFVSASTATVPELESDDADTPDSEDAPAEDTADAGPSARAADGVRFLADGPVDDDALAAAERCLDEVLAADADAIPAYLAVVTYEGDPAVVVGLVTLDPASGAYTRAEVWVLDRADCQVRRFAQG